MGDSWSCLSCLGAEEAPAVSVCVCVSSVFVGL